MAPEPWMPAKIVPFAVLTSPTGSRGSFAEGGVPCGTLVSTNARP